MAGNEFDDSIEFNKELIKRYENAHLNNEQAYFDESELEEIVDYYIENERFDEAIQVAQFGIDQFTFSSLFYQKMAEIYMEIQYLDKAIEFLDQALGFAPNETALILLKADVFTLQGKYQKAVEIINEVIDVADDLDKIDMYLELADVYEEWEKYYEVIENLQNCLLIDNENEEALNRIWFATELTEGYEESILFHLSLIDKNPYNVGAWYNLAHAYNGVNGFEKSKEAFEFVLAIDEEYEVALIDLGDLYYNQKIYDKAIEYYLEAIEKGASKKDLFYQIAKSYGHQGKFVKAREYFKKVINIDPYFARAFHKLGLTYLESDLPKNAIAPLERSVKLDAKNYDFINALAAAYFLNKENEKALEQYYAMLQINEYDKRVYLNIVSILYEQGRVGDAIDSINTAIELFDDNADLLYIKTVFLYELGKKNEMFETLLKALEKNVEGHTQLFDLLPEMQDDNAVMALIESYL